MTATVLIISKHKKATKIVMQIETEQKTINETKKLIKIFEAKIKDKIQEIWGE